MISLESVDMASENDFLHRLRFSGDREKLDGLQLIDTESPEDAKSTARVHNESDRKRPRPEPNYNVRNSLAWDSAFFTSSGVLELEELFGTANSRFTDNLVDIFEDEDEILLPSDSLEPRAKSRGEKCDLRKSLAWDSAFFTNAGVLDPEELSIVNRGFKNLGTHLPGIQEDVSRSNESTFSVDSGSSSLTSLEIDLFEDIREFSHKSTSELSLSAPSLKFQSAKGSNKLVPSSRTRVKDMPTSQRQNISSHGAERSKKKVSLSAPSSKQLSAGSGKLNSSLFLKPPKASDRTRNTPTSLSKSAPLDASLVKMGNAKSASGQCLTVPKKPSPGNLDSISYCSTPSPKSSSFGFPTAAHKSVSCSRSNSGSTFKTPLRHTIRKKAELRSSHRSSYVFSTPTSSSCTSPDSSLDGWSSVSSSTSAIEKSNNSELHLNSNSREVSSERIASRESDLHQSFTGLGSQGRKLLNHHIKKTPLGTGSVPSTVSKNTKPSGLRMPSPKIGYFDEGDSSIATTDGSKRFPSGTQSAMLKVGSGVGNLMRPASRAKNGKPMISRTISGTPMQNGPESTLQIMNKNPTEIGEVQNASRNEPAARATIKICFPMALKVEKDLPQKNCHDCMETETGDSKGQDAAIQGTQSSSKAESQCAEGSMVSEFDTKHREIIVPRAKNRTPQEYEEHKHCPGKNVIIVDDSDKENIYSFKEQVDGLSRYLGTINLGSDVVIELKVNKSPSDPRSTVLTLKI